MIGVVGGLELEVNQVDGEIGGAHKEDLHGRVVETHVVRDQVQVPCCVRESKQQLGLPRNPYT